MAKKLLSLFLTVAMIVTMIPAMAFAEDEPAPTYYTVTFYDFAGQSILKQDMIPIDQAAGISLRDLMPADPEKAEYTFAGWSKTKKKKGAYKFKETLPDDARDAQGNLIKDEDDLVNNPYLGFDFDNETLTGDLELYPMFVKDRLRVHLDLGAYDQIASDLATWNDDYSWYDSSKYDPYSPAVMHENQARSFTVNIDEKIRMSFVDDAGEVHPEQGMLGATREGYDLAGWYTSGGILWNDETDEDDPHSMGNPGMSWRDATTEDKWWQMTPEFTDKVNGVAERVATNLNYSYYTVTLTARWALKPGQIEYDLDGGHWPEGSNQSDTQAVAPGAFAMLTTTTPEREEGEVFIGWENEMNQSLYQGGGGFVYNDISTVTDFDNTQNKIKMVARYKTEGHYTVIFDTLGMSFTQTPPEEIDTNTEYVTADDPRDDIFAMGYELEGWYLDSNYSEGSKVTFDENKKAQIPVSNANVYNIIYLYAKWEKAPLHIQYTDGSTTLITRNVESGKIVPNVTEAELRAEGPDSVREKLKYYTLKGWEPEFMVGGPAFFNFSLDAVWTAKRFTIKFMDGNETVSTSYRVPYGSVITDIPHMQNKIVEGEGYFYEFLGWQVEQMPEAVFIPYALMSSLADYANDRNVITLHAVWSKVPNNCPVVRKDMTTSTSITIETLPGQDYSFDDITWRTADDSGLMTFDNLQPDTLYYTISTRYTPEDENAFMGRSYHAAERTRQAAPEIEASATGTKTVSVDPAVEDAEYVIVSKGKTLKDSDWTKAKQAADGQVNFTGLSADTEYDIYGRMTDKEYTNGSDVSGPVTVKTYVNTGSSPKFGIGDVHVQDLGNQTIDLGIELRNNTSGAKSATVMAALYRKNGQFVGMKTVDANLPKTANTHANIDGWQVPESGTYILKVMLMESGQNPLGKSASMTVTIQ